MAFLSLFIVSQEKLKDCQGSPWPTGMRYRVQSRLKWFHPNVCRVWSGLFTPVGPERTRTDQIS